MYLKKLELQGFKSFPERLRLEFNPGITAVVGPNGSGKSNISDALRWVLGEQSVRSLRGVKMEDVIFSGTETRRPLSTASVTMYIDNSDYALPCEYSEVSITRRIYRVGDSEYLINGTNCRLKDIYELFMDTGIGKEGYSIIGQGRIEEVLSIRSDERRYMFEEVAGIVKFKTRKLEAEGKLEKERQNLERVNDIISELSSQLDAISVEAEVAKKYLDIKERLKLIQVNIFLNDVDKLSDELAEIQARLDETKELAEKEEQENLRLKEEIKRKKKMLSEKESELNDQKAGVAEMRSTAEQRANDIVLKQEQISHISGELLRLKSEALAKQKNLQALQEAKLAENEKLKLHSDSLQEQNTLLTLKEDEFIKAKAGMSKSQQQLEDYNTELMQRYRESAVIKAKAENLDTLSKELHSKKSDSEEELKQTLLKIGDNQKKHKSVSNTLAQIKSQTEGIKQEISSLNFEKDAVNIRLTNRNAELNLVNNELSEKLSKAKVLSELEKNYEGYFKSVRAVLQKNNAEWGICGAVGELVYVPSEYETAIQVALGSAMQNLVARDEEGIQKAIEYLKTSNNGRATFLPINVINEGKTRKLAVRDQIIEEQGVLGIAKELVSYDPVYEGIFSDLLDRVLIVDNMENAIRINKKYNYSVKIVTLEGELFNPGGAITGGSLSKNTSNIFSRSREIRELKTDIENLKEKENHFKTQIQELSDQVKTLDEEILDKKDELTDRTIQEGNLENILDQVNQFLKELNQKKTRLEEEAQSLVQRQASTAEGIQKTAEELAKSEQIIKNLQGEINSFQASLTEEREHREQKSNELTQIKVKISGLEESLRAIKENLVRIKGEISAHEADILSIAALTEENKGKMLKRQDEIEALKEELVNLQKQRTEAEVEIRKAGKGLEEIEKSITEAEASQLRQLEYTSKLSNEYTKLEAKQNQLIEDNKKLYDQMWDEYKLTLNRAKEEFIRLDTDLRQLQREEVALKKAIEDLGFVNVNAINEHIKLKERFDFLQKQRDDILSAEASLLDLIKQLTEQMENRFLEQFKLISENFTAVFQEMFGGGKAYLKLFDENKALESGIDIIAQPPNKNLQSLSLLSGGERALTAIALLFAILRLKPSPFCVLDEIDAALDDANVRRFANFLSNYCKDTQFIVVTHRKGTMEVSDRLYGVTMQEGISKLISVTLEDVKEDAAV